MRSGSHVASIYNPQNGPFLLVTECHVDFQVFSCKNITEYTYFPCSFEGSIWYTWVWTCDLEIFVSLSAYELNILVNFRKYSFVTDFRKIVMAVLSRAKIN